MMSCICLLCLKKQNKTKNSEAVLFATGKPTKKVEEKQ